MPDPSGESLPPSHEQPGGPRLPAPPGEPAHLAPAPRARPVTAQHAKPPSKTPPPPPGSRAVLEWLRQYGDFDLDPDDPLPSAAGGDPRSTQARLSKEQRKFHKFDPEHPQPRSAASGEPTSSHSVDYPDTGSSRDDSPRGISYEQLANFRRLHENSSVRRLWIALTVAVVAFLGLSGAFVVNHLPSAKPAVDSPQQVIVPSRTASDPSATAAPATALGVMEVLDQATAAETAANYTRAIQLFEQARHDAGHVYGLNYHLASLCYKANQMTKVLPLLGLSISEGEQVAACYSLRGTLLNQTEGTPQEPGDLEKATRLEPLNASFFFVWGEALRKAGKPELALPQLRRAVERLQEPALASVYSLKFRLAQIELEQGDALNSDLVEKLRESPPPGDWLLTAAALEMQHGDYSAAAAALDKLRAQAGDRALARELKDVFFRRFTHEPELTRFFDGLVSP